jgi:leucyl aminopeptidase
MTSGKSDSVELSLRAVSPESAKTGILVIGAFVDGALPFVSQKVDQASQGRLSATLKRGDLTEKAGSTLLLHELPGNQAERILVVSLGQRDKFDEKAYRDALSGTAKALASSSAKDAVVAIADVDVPGRNESWKLQEASRIIVDGAYNFELTKSSNNRDKTRGTRKIALLITTGVSDDLEKAIERGQAIAEGMALAKDLGNLPGNICTPTYLANTAQELGKKYKFRVKVFDSDQMKRFGMGAALSVGQGSAQPCKFIVMEYRGAGNTKPIVLVGKGVTFDSGGISLKPGANMDEMKFDMCGAASVFGAMKTVAELQLPINLVALIPAVENMPGSNAMRPGDVIRSMSGQTIEVLNTDAEGRLGLADALTFAEFYNPECVIDVATLTGACVIALGNVTSGLFANDDDLADHLLKSGDDTGDRAWRLPMFDEYQDLLKSNFADMSNLGGRPAGAITAACFLKRFASKYRWAHMDIAGTNAVSGDAKGATGRPVPLLTQFLIDRAESSALRNEDRSWRTTRARAA